MAHKLSDIIKGKINNKEEKKEEIKKLPRVIHRFRSPFKNNNVLFGQSVAYDINEFKHWEYLYWEHLYNLQNIYKDVFKMNGQRYNNQKFTEHFNKFIYLNSSGKISKYL